ncbi:hypothetical protein N7539_005868 [Penicillium diatomitis]|uniref:CoA-binding domain-containing protein n=1 Tax=Penicillium diatomitis TaxID=2819901 RepID=A0A9X0BTX9_9EURO|nr:uncharacterized protein N7539_005868 [Penicillium diatomitis]KAJ5484072.1 hypothetical protein N7539_005868 [Penicillium diatomitis]
MEAVKRFFSSPRFAVAGASNDPTKFGYKNLSVRGHASPVTLQVLQEAHSVGIPAVWLQPGTFDDRVLDYARGHFAAVIAGDGGAGYEGWCVLVDGEEGLEAAGVQWTSQRL